MDGDIVKALGLEWTGPAPLATTLAALEKTWTTLITVREAEAELDRI